MILFKGKKISLALLMIFFIFISLLTFFLWNAKGINQITGDEPHYLVISDGLVKYHSFEVFKPYTDEFGNKVIYSDGLIKSSSAPNPQNTHSVLGPNGLYSVHNIGLPVLLAIPYFLYGVAGSKLFMILMASLVVYVTFKLANEFDDRKFNVILITLMCTISASTIPQANQIYPDFLAGIISLFGIFWFFTLERDRKLLKEVFFIALLSFLPWLQIKFGICSFILILSIILKTMIVKKDIKRIVTFILIASVSCVLLLIYNKYAFGFFAGPYENPTSNFETLELSKTSLMVLLGLIFDQNQGFLFQNIFFFGGLIGIGLLYRISKITFIVWMLTFLSLILPNSMHPNWYGGWSICGRFGMASAILFILPTIIALSYFVDKTGFRIKYITLSSVFLIQIWFFYCYAIADVNIYNIPLSWLNIWPELYSNFYFPADSFLPMLYNSDWAFHYLPNYSWFVLILTLIILGFKKGKIGCGYLKLGFSVFLIIILSGFFNGHVPYNRVDKIFTAKELPSQTGRLVGSYRIVQSNIDKKGYLNFGPGVFLRKGDYEVTIKYSSNLSKNKNVLFFDVYDSHLDKKIVDLELNGTAGLIKEKKVRFRLDNLISHPIEFRTFWFGDCDVNLVSIAIKPLH